MHKDLAGRLKVGDIVIIYTSILGVKSGSVAIVYELYTDFDDKHLKGVSIISECGTDLGGFGKTDQIEYLEYVRSTDLVYNFTDVRKLKHDFKKIKRFFYEDK